MKLITIISIIAVKSDEKRADEIKNAFKELWKNYSQNGFGSDEISPVSGNRIDGKLQGWGATLVDSLSTLWLMDLKDEFKESVEQVKKINFTSNGQPIMLFDSTVKYLGGLISAYDLSGEEILLDKAVTLADILIPAFDSPYGLPYYGLDIKNKKTINKGYVVLEEIGTLQLEFSRLTELTKNPIYREKAYKVYDHLNSLIKQTKGLYPVALDQNTGQFITKQVSFGTSGGGFYECLLKSYILDKGRAQKQMFDDSMSGLEILLREINQNVYVGEIDIAGQFQYVMDHNAFSISSLLALNSFVTEDKAWVEVSEKLALSSYKTYNQSKTGLGPEKIGFGEEGHVYLNPENKLKPELLESFYYLYKFTGKPMYQDWAYRIYKAFEEHSKVHFGYGGYKDVNNILKETQLVDKMDSYFFAETFKYLYLIFKPRSYIDFGVWVLSAGGHPIKINKH